MTFILLEKKKARCSVLMVDSAIPCSVPVPLTPALGSICVPLRKSCLRNVTRGGFSAKSVKWTLCRYSCEETQQDAVGPALHLIP